MFYESYKKKEAKDEKEEEEEETPSEPEDVSDDAKEGPEEHKAEEREFKGFTIEDADAIERQANIDIEDAKAKMAYSMKMMNIGYNRLSLAKHIRAIVTKK